MTAVVKHPEVDEQLAVHECVVRVGCPVCKVKAGTPCKGARFKWLERGTRKGFRYTQGAHRPRYDLFKAWDSAGAEAQLSEGLRRGFTTTHGEFPTKVDRTTVVPDKRKAPAPRSKRRTKKRSADPNKCRIEHKGCIWESYSDGKQPHCLWSWMPWREQGDFMSISVFDYRPGWVTVGIGRHDHKCESREAGFDLAIELAGKAELLRVFNERKQWRIDELERRFGAALNEQENNDSA